MITLSEIKQMIQKSIPDAHVHVSDMTDTGDHFEIFVSSQVFQGKLLIDQHRIVQKALETAMNDGRIHAVKIKTETPGLGNMKSNSENDFNIIQ